MGVHAVYKQKFHRTVVVSLFKMLEIANHIRIKICIISKSHFCSKYTHKHINKQEAAARQMIEVCLSTSFLLFCQRKSFQYVESETQN